MPTATRTAGGPLRHADDRRQRRIWILHLFQQRVKDLVAKMLQDETTELAALMNEVVAILPSAWQYPEAASARILLGEREFRTPNFRSTPWRQAAPFITNDGLRGLIEVDYLKEFPNEAEGPFLAEERSLINFLADMFHSFMGRKRARQALLDARDELELRVKERTEQLRSLASELSLTEERERRAIAANLHDCIGQTLAMAKIKIRELSQAQASQSPARELAELAGLIEEAIQFTRSLTFELSSPILYELGFEAAVEALAEQVQKKHGIVVTVDDGGGAKPLADEVKVILFKAVRELLTNAVKHSQARRIKIAVRKAGHAIEVRVEDDGVGFEAAQTAVAVGKPGGFGLFSIREGLRHCGGEFVIRSQPNRGAKAELRAPLRTASRRT